jgi:hypothetical protein
VLETTVAERTSGRPWYQTWTLDLIIEAMKEIFDPHRFDDNVEKWKDWIREAKKNLKVDYTDMEGFRTRYAGGLAAALVDFNEPPSESHKTIMGDLQRILTASGNPHRNNSPNLLFQADLDKDCAADEAYKRSPTVDALARLVSARITRWQKDKAYNDKRYESSSSSAPDDVSEAQRKKPRHEEQSRKAPILSAVSAAGERCNGCGHPGHIRRVCRYSKFPDWNAEGPWEGSDIFKKIKAKMSEEGTPTVYPVLPRHGGPPNYDKRERRDDRKRDRERPPRADSLDRNRKRDRSPLPRGRRQRLHRVSTDPLIRPVARPRDAVVSA